MTLKEVARRLGIPSIELGRYVGKESLRPQDILQVLREANRLTAPRPPPRAPSFLREDAEGEDGFIAYAAQDLMVAHGIGDCLSPFPLLRPRAPADIASVG